MLLQSCINHKSTKCHKARRLGSVVCVACVVCVVCIACTPHPNPQPQPLIITQPPAISVESVQKQPATALPRRYDTFWNAIKNADFPVAQRLATSTEQRQLSQVLAYMLEGETDSAEQLIVPLLQAQDSVVQNAARVTYGALLSAQSQWSRLATFVDSFATPTNQTTVNEAGVEAWALAFRHTTPTQHFVDSSIVLPFVRTPTGTPLIAIRVNGIVKHFWIDTGSSITILSSAAAAECGVTPIQADTLELQTSVGRLPAQPTAVHELQVGGLQISDVPAMIVNTSLLTLRTNKSALTPTVKVQIDGIIGFDIIRNIDLTIDDARGVVVIRQPVVRPADPQHPRNLFWFGVPIAALTSSIGITVHLSLDTGAEETYGTQSLVTKTGAQAVTAERRTVQGFGGGTLEHGIVVPRVRLFLDRTPLVLQRVFLYTAQYPTIFELDGTLGADIGRGNVLRIDMTNGRLDLASH